MLRTIDIHFSAICNLDCYYCYNNNSSFNRQHTSVLTQEQIDKFIALVLIPKYQSDTHYISFVGGEPLVFPDLIIQTFNLIKTKYSNFNVKFNITTNGLLLTQSILEKLLSYGFYLNFQLSAHVFSIAEYYHKQNEFIKTIRLCNSHKVEYKVLYIIDKNNFLDTIPNLVKLLRSGAKVILPGIDCFFTKWTTQDYRDIVFLYEKIFLLRKKLSSDAKILNLMADNGTGLEFDRHTDGDSCMTGFQKDSLGILSNGDIFTCLYYTCVPIDDNYEKIKYGHVDSTNEIDFQKFTDINYVKKCGFYSTGSRLSAILQKIYSHKN